MYKWETEAGALTQTQHEISGVGIYFSIGGTKLRSYFNNIIMHGV